MTLQSRKITGQTQRFETKFSQISPAVSFHTVWDICDPLSASGRAHLLARANLSTGNYEDALKAYKQIPKQRADYQAEMAACHSMLGQTEQSDACVERTLFTDPEFSVESYMARQKFKQAVDLDRWRDSLLATTLPR